MNILDMLCSVIESSHSVIPLAGGQRAGSGTGRSDFTSGCVPGWKEEVEPFQEDARFWHSLWLSAGKPNRGDFYIAMTRSRNQYHYAVRRTRRSRDLLRAKKLFEASLIGDIELIKEMKKVKKGCNVNAELPDSVGGVQGQEEIVEKFKEVYSALYNSASTADDVDIIKDKLNILISEGLCSDAILNGPDYLISWLVCTAYGGFKCAFFLNQYFGFKKD